MIKMLKFEWRRLWKSYSFYIALLIGFIIAVSQVIQYVIPYAKSNDSNVNNPDFVLPHSVFNSMMGFNLDWQSSFLYNIMPLLAAIPYGFSYYLDKKNGYIKNLYTRTERKNYIFSKYIITFFSGGLVCMLPWIINMIGTMMFVPIIKPIPGTHIFSMESADIMVGDLFFSKPILYICFFGFEIFLIGGMLASMCLSAVYLVNGIFIIQFFPYIFVTVYNMAVSMINNKCTFLVSLNTLIRIEQHPIVNVCNMSLTFLVFLSVSAFYFVGAFNEKVN